jgi:ubiquitin-like protein ATG12
MLITTLGFWHDLTVVVRFKAVGNAPIMKTNFYKITASNRFQAVIQFLRKELGWKSGDPLVSLLIF